MKNPLEQTKEEPKEYNLKTLKDILEAVNSDNIDNFLIDFESWLRIFTTTKDLAKILGGEAEMDKLVWIDDGKNNRTINIQVKEEL